MTVRHVKTDTTIGEVLDAASQDGVIVQPDKGSSYAIMPLDDDLIDYLLEKNPRFISDCQQIRERMRRGKYKTYDEVKKMFESD
jgi:hypothetical protein